MKPPAEGTDWKAQLWTFGSMVLFFYMNKNKSALPIDIFNCLFCPEALNTFTIK